MGATGTTTINFGAYPGKLDTSVAVTGQASILSGSLAEAWIWPVGTAAHSADEHVLGAIEMAVVAGNVVAGVGFTIYAVARDNTPGIGSEDGNYRNLPRKIARLYGTYTVAWAWV